MNDVKDLKNADIVYLKYPENCFIKILGISRVADSRVVIVIGRKLSGNFQDMYSFRLFAEEEKTNFVTFDGSSKELRT